MKEEGKIWKEGIQEYPFDFERYIEERAWSRRQRENQGFWCLAIIVLFFIVALIK